MSNKTIITNFQNLVDLKKKELFNAKKNDNKKLVNELNFKIRNFNNVIKIIKNFNEDIKNIEQLKNIKGIGKGTLHRIEEILNTNTLKELKELKELNNEIKNNQLNIELLKSITGIGEVKANDLLKKNISLDILLKEYEKYKNNIEESDILKNLTHHQIIGLKYYYDLKLVIPRDEIKKIEIRIKKWIKLIDPDLQIIVCGSYRRGKDKCGDIDILILHEKIKTKEDIDKCEIKYLQLVVKNLQSKNILVDNLTEAGNTKYMGICKLVSRSKGRRIDIRFIPYNSKASALLYFTGSGNFNENMRADAKKKGYMINEYGLYKVNKNGENKLIETETEEDIFKKLDMEYKLPKDRF